MFLSKLQEGLFCLRLPNTIHESGVARTQGRFFRERIPVPVGQRCLDHWAAKVNSSSNGSDKGDMLDTGGDGLADDV